VQPAKVRFHASVHFRLAVSSYRRSVRQRFRLAAARHRAVELAPFSYTAHRERIRRWQLLALDGELSPNA